MAMRNAGCSAMNFADCGRDSFLRNTTNPFAAAPCSWNTFFARLMPMILIFSMDAVSFSLCFQHHNLATARRHQMEYGSHSGAHQVDRTCPGHMAIFEGHAEEEAAFFANCQGDG